MNIYLFIELLILNTLNLIIKKYIYIYYVIFSFGKNNIKCFKKKFFFIIIVF